MFSLPPSQTEADFCWTRALQGCFSWGERRSVLLSVLRGWSGLQKSNSFCCSLWVCHCLIFPVVDEDVLSATNSPCLKVVCCKQKNCHLTLGKGAQLVCYNHSKSSQVLHLGGLLKWQIFRGTVWSGWEPVETECIFWWRLSEEEANWKRWPSKGRCSPSRSLASCLRNKQLIIPFAAKLAILNEFWEAGRVCSAEIWRLAVPVITHWIGGRFATQLTWTRQAEGSCQ